jgi:hypothetical protein
VEAAQPIPENACRIMRNSEKTGQKNYAISWKLFKGFVKLETDGGGGWHYGTGEVGDP